MKNRKFWVSFLAGLMAAVMLLGLVAGLIPTRAKALSSSEIRDQIDALEDKNADLESQMAELDSQMSENLEEIQALAGQKRRIDQQVFLLYEQINVINEQLAAYGVLIADKQDELDDANARFTDLSDQYRERIRAMEEDGALSYWSVLFKANSFSDLLDRLNMIEEIAASDTRRLAELDEAARVVKQAQQDLEAEKAELETTKAELETTRETLADKRAEADELLTALLARGEEYEAMMLQAEEDQRLLMQEIAQKEDEYDEAAYLEWLATYVPPTTTKPPYVPPTEAEDGDDTGDTGSGDTGDNSSGGDYDEEKWLVPVDWYILTSPFGMREHPIYGGQIMHEGVDLACNEGNAIYASRSGVVRNASYTDSAGYYVSINHGDGFSSIYMHMTHYVVSSGDYVYAGQIIGYVGSTGASTGPHLHFGISYNGTYVNPMNYI